ncbi:hypothetical protein ACFUIW_16295 [Streptomyces sp. NPDC057245]|uniref:hypothetical protein n=1 Tax=Streptomyces sp. NPDC057245 TaxID=3346065 RepID=UPI003629A803
MPVKPIVLPVPQRGEVLPARVSAPVTGSDLQQVTLAYLCHITGIDHTDWETAQAALAGDSHSLGRLESKTAPVPHGTGDAVEPTS